MGDQTVYQYDPAGDIVRELHFGPVGGPSPTSDGPGSLAGPVSLQRRHPGRQPGELEPALGLGELLRRAGPVLSDVPGAFREHDPDAPPGRRGRGGRRRRAGEPDARPDAGDSRCRAASPSSGASPIGPSTTATRGVTFTVADDLATTHTFYDGDGRAIETVDPDGNTFETAYDGDDNVIETRETDVSQVAGVAPEVFLTTNFYDSLNRLQETVDNLGETTDYRYDSRGNLVATADADGPVGPAIARRAFPVGPRTVDATNLFGNVTLYFYDGLDRQTMQEQILTASGQGDGVHIGASIFGVKDDPAAPESFPPPADPSQGGGDGIIRTGTVWDGNSLPVRGDRRQRQRHRLPPRQPRPPGRRDHGPDGRHAALRRR